MARADALDDGFVLLHRRLLDNTAFRSPAEAMAFAYLVLRASWRPCRVRYKEREIVLERGQLAMSVRDFAAAMDRPKSWVQRFIDRLEAAKMVQRKRDSGGTGDGTAPNVLTICNYEKYQDRSAFGGTATKPETGQHRDTEQRRERRKEKKEERKPPTPFAPPEWVPREAWLGWLEVRKKNRWPMTDRALSLAVKDMEKLVEKGHDPVKLLDMATLRGWRGIFEDKGGATLTKAKQAAFNI